MVWSKHWWPHTLLSIRGRQKGLRGKGICNAHAESLCYRTVPGCLLGCKESQSRNKVPPGPQPSRQFAYGVSETGGKPSESLNTLRQSDTICSSLKDKPLGIPQIGTGWAKSDFPDICIQNTHWSIFYIQLSKYGRGSGKIDIRTVVLHDLPQFYIVLYI